MLLGSCQAFNTAFILQCNENTSAQCLVTWFNCSASPMSLTRLPRFHYVGGCRQPAARVYRAKKAKAGAECANKSSNLAIMPKKRKLPVNSPRLRGGPSICNWGEQAGLGELCPITKARHSIHDVQNVSLEQAEVCPDVTHGPRKAKWGWWALQTPLNSQNQAQAGCYGKSEPFPVDRLPDHI